MILMVQFWYKLNFINGIIDTYTVAATKTIIWWIITIITKINWIIRGATINEVKTAVIIIITNGATVVELFE